MYVCMYSCMYRPPTSTSRTYVFTEHRAEPKPNPWGLFVFVRCCHGCCCVNLLIMGMAPREARGVWSKTSTHRVIRQRQGWLLERPDRGSTRSNTTAARRVGAQPWHAAWEHDRGTPRSKTNMYVGESDSVVVSLIVA